MLFWEGHAALDAGSVVSKWPSATGPSGSALVAEKSLTQVIHIASGAKVRAKGRPSWLMGVILTAHLTPRADCAVDQSFWVSTEARLLPYLLLLLSLPLVSMDPKGPP